MSITDFKTEEQRDWSLKDRDGKEIRKPGDTRVCVRAEARCEDGRKIGAVGLFDYSIIGEAPPVPEESLRRQLERFAARNARAS
jgi:hypothetical protein